MRTPVVLIMTWLIGRALTESRISKNCGWIVGSPPDSWTRSGSPSLSTSASGMRPAAGLEPQPLRPPIHQIVADQRLLHSVVAAALEVEDPVVLDDHLGRHRY